MSARNALSSQFPDLDPTLAQFCDMRYDVVSVQHVQPTSHKDCAIVVLSCGANRLKFLNEENKLLDVQLTDSATIDVNLRNVWSAKQDMLVVQLNQSLYLLTVVYEEGVALGDINKLLDLDDNIEEFALSWNEVVGVSLVTFTPLEEESSSGPIIYPPPRKQKQLSVYNAQNGWVKVARVSGLADSLCVSDDGSMAAFIVRLHHVPEEAERGEVYCCALKDETETTSHVKQLTSGAGRVNGVMLSPDGNQVLYDANFSAHLPITTHTELYIQSTLANISAERRVVVSRPEGAGVWKYAWSGNEKGQLSKQLNVTFAVGPNLVTKRVDLSDGAKEAPDLEPPMTNTSITTLVGGKNCYMTDSAKDYPILVADDEEITLPYPGECTMLFTDLVECESEDGYKLYAYLHSHAKSKKDAPLLIHAHGGPAASWPHRRYDSAGSTRYPYRHLLFAGYKVLAPMFRGTLGFGDKFAAANIRCQGNDDLDDILKTIEATIKAGHVAASVPLGIFGGSYGGYMTTRALSRYPDKFKCAVSEYGFIATRWMSLEGGDLTWELEYTGDIEWPLTEEAQVSDCYLDLHKIRTPTLFTHGQDDDICPLSQSLVAYRTLQSVAVPTGLVVYPGEGHGYENLDNRNDRAARILAWFLEFMPTSLIVEPPAVAV